VANWITSPYWDEARRTGFTALAYAEVLVDGEIRETLEVSGGTVTCDEKSRSRRTLSLSLSDIGLEPRTAEDLLAPFGTELAVYAGMGYGGTTEYVPVGVFAIEQAGRQGWTSDLQIDAMDRGGVLAEARFLSPWNSVIGTPAVEEIAAIILSVLPNVEVFDITGSDRPIGRATWDRDRWEAIDYLAKGLGAEVFFDQAGRVVIREVPTVGAAMVEDETNGLLHIHANRDDSDLLDVATGLSRADVYNAVVATSDQETAPVSAIAYQATGPLRYRPGFQKPRFFSTPVITSYDGIGKAAASLLAKSLAYSRKISPTIIADYSMDAGSVVQVVLPDESSETRILSSFSINLGEGSMACTTRVDPEWDLTDEPQSLSSGSLS
jgi:hypothetical protein